MTAPSRGRGARRRHRRPVHPAGGRLRRRPGPAQPGGARPAGRGGAPARDRCLPGRGLRAGLRGRRLRAPRARRRWGSTPPRRCWRRRASSRRARMPATSPGTGATPTPCRSRTAPSTSSAAASRSTTCRSRRAPSPRWCGSPAPAAASCCATPSPPTIRPRPRPSTPWSGTATLRRWSSARWRFSVGLYAIAGLPAPEVRFYQVPAERERVVAMSFPEGGDRDGLRAMLDASVDGDTMGVGARRDGETMRFAYPAAVLVAVKGRG